MIATFSILGDLVKNVGGDRVEVTTLVGAERRFPRLCADAGRRQKVGAAKVVFINGLGFEGWITRLVKASGTKAPTITVSKGIKTRKMEDDHGHGHTATDPHAWQSVSNAKIYVANIRDGLIAADPAGKSTYEANASAYLAKLDALEAEVKDAIGKIPADRRRIITSHDAFGYFGAAYGIEFIAPTGVSTEAAVSARDVAKIIAQIRKQKIPAVFMENVTDPRMMEQIDAKNGGEGVRFESARPASRIVARQRSANASDRSKSAAQAAAVEALIKQEYAMSGRPTRVASIAACERGS